MILMLNPNEKNYKIIIFDFDETLYFHPRALDFYVKFIKNAICDLSGCDEKKAMSLIHKYGFDQRGEKRVSFAKTCKEFGIDVEAWDKYKITHFFEVDYDGAYTVDNSLLEELAKNYTLLILSNELYEHIIYKAQKLKINLSVFDRIYAPSAVKGIPATSKKETFIKICEDYKAAPQQLFAIGDRYQVDVLPLIEIGGKGTQVADTIELEKILKNELLPIH